jgi:hypothetical protein
METATTILNVRSPEEYKARALAHLKKHKRYYQPQDEPLVAGFDCGRWVVNCACGGGIALHPDWQYAACFTCGKAWTSVQFPTPEFMEQLRRILEVRPAGSVRGNVKRFWSWWPGETLDDLRRENRRRGWPEGRG